MPVTDAQIALLRKQQMLVEQLKAVLATQQRTLASLGAVEEDYENAAPKERAEVDSDNEGEATRIKTDAEKSSNRSRRTANDKPQGEAANQDWTSEEANEEERGFMSVKPWLGAMTKPSTWDWAASATRDNAPALGLQLSYVHGYRARGSRSNIAYVDSHTIVYPVAALAVVFDVDTKKQTFFQGHDDDVLCLDYNATRRIVATGQQGKNANVCVWSVDDPSTPIAVFKGHKRAVTAVAISADGTKVASIGLDDQHTLMIHDIDTKSLVSSSACDTNRVLGVYWNRTAAADSTKELVTVGVKHIHFWTLSGAKLDSRKGLLGRGGEYQGFLDADFTPDYTLVATESGDVYVFEGNKLKSKMHAHNGAVFSVCSDLKTSVVITGGRDGFANIWDRNTLKNIGTIDVNSADACTGLNSVKALKIFPGDEPKLLIGTITNSIYEVVIAKGRSSLKTLMISHFGDLAKADSYGEAWALATHPKDADIVASGAQDGTVRTWKMSTHTQVARASVGAGARTVAFSPDGKYVSVGLFNGTVTLLNSIDLSEVSKLRKHKTDIHAVTFSPDGKTLAVGCQDRTIDLYTVANDDLSFVATMSGPTSNVLSLDFSADGKYLQACTQAYELLYFDVAGAKMFTKTSDLKDTEWATFTSKLGWSVQGIWLKEADGSDINWVNKNNKGDLCVVADDDGAVRVFNYPCVGSGLDRRGSLSRRPAHVAGFGHSEHVTNAAFTANDSHIVSIGGADNALILWKVVPQ